MITKKDFRLFAALTAWAILPSLYLLVRMHIVSINGVDLNILGQMEWFDLIDEVLVTALTIPLYSLLRPKDDGNSAGANTAAFLASLIIYTGFTAIAVLHISGIAAYMNASGSEHYLTLQAFSLLIGFIATFGVLLLTINGDEKAVRRLTIIRLVSLIVLDHILISAHRDIGAAYSEIVTNAVVACSIIAVCIGRRYLVRPVCIEKAFFVSWAKRGLFAGVQIFLDNFIYAIMICKMVNAVNESGNYWVANNFIWGWLLIPVTCLAEIIRKNSVSRLTMKNTWRYGIAIAAFWVVTLPFWPWFIRNAMAIENADAILRIVYPSMIFYLTYIPSALLDSWFISTGKTWCLTVISAVVNLVYYGILYLLFQKGVLEASMSFIIGMFGWGMVVHLLLSMLLYHMQQRVKS